MDSIETSCMTQVFWEAYEKGDPVDRQVSRHIKICEFCGKLASDIDAKLEAKVLADAKESPEFRKLVTVREVDDLLPIEGADRIEVAVVGGWKVVVKKGEFEVGHKGLFFEIDSFLPADPRFAFLDKAPREFRGFLGYRIKTIKLRGQISQGLLLPLSLFPEIRVDEIPDNLTKLLGVNKWEKVYTTSNSRCVIGRAKGNFPSFIQKTDQERLQSMTQILDKSALGLHEFEVTTKMDGSSLTAYVQDGRVGVCSRNLELKNADGDFSSPEVKAQQSDYWKVVIDFEVDKMLQLFWELYRYPIALQMEFVGPGINGNYQKLKEWDLYLFDVYHINQQRYFTPNERQKYDFFFSGNCKLKHVPVVGRFFALNPEGLPRMERFAQLMALADSTESPTPGVMAEGLVFKDEAGTNHFKLISNNYLLKYDSKE